MDVLSCSFCAKSQRDVSKLIAGPSVYICSPCVVICVEILAGDFGTPYLHPKPSRMAELETLMARAEQALSQNREIEGRITDLLARLKEKA